jgi:hypothetical protein
MAKMVGISHSSVQRIWREAAKHFPLSSKELYRCVGRRRAPSFARRRPVEH